MTLTIDLPEELASRLTALLPEEERTRFSVAAIADALIYRENEQDCVEVVEQALIDMDAGRGLISFEEVCRQWEAEKLTQEIRDSK
jgi:predicted transcriptional regulator